MSEQNGFVYDPTLGENYVSFVALEDRMVTLLDISFQGDKNEPHLLFRNSSGECEVNFKNMDSLKTALDILGSDPNRPYLLVGKEFIASYDGNRFVRFRQP